MKEVAISAAFSAAPPRRPAVVCVREQGKTCWKSTLWFTWLNMKHQPMLSFALERDSGIKLRAGDPLVLAFLPIAETERYKELTQIDGADSALPEQTAVALGDIQIPGSSEMVLRCSLSNAYNYPFKNVRIYNCNLEKALCLNAEE